MSRFPLNDLADAINTWLKLSQKGMHPGSEGISDEYLEKVYASSACLIAASQGEGFWLPLIEAAQHKLPIIARDIPVFREVAGEHAHYFSGLDQQALVDVIKNWLALKAASKVPQSAGMAWLTWAQSTQQLLKNFRGRSDE